MDTIIENIASIASSLAAIFAAIAAWHSYKTSQATLNAILNREKPQLDLQSTIDWKSNSNNNNIVKLTLYNSGESYSRFTDIRLKYNETNYSLTNKDSVAELSSILNLNLGFPIDILQFDPSEFSLSSGRAIPVLLVLIDKDEQGDELSREIHEKMSNISLQCDYEDCHGRTYIDSKLVKK